MTFEEAIEVLHKNKEQETKKYILKLFDGFIKVLEALKARDLTNEQVKDIEQKLDELELKANPDNKKRYFTSKYGEFTKYLEAEYSWVTEGHYMRQGMMYGMIFGPGIGLTFGTMFGAVWISIGLSLGVGMGMALGIAFGSLKDNEAKKEGRVL